MGVVCMDGDHEGNHAAKRWLNYEISYGLSAVISSTYARFTKSSQNGACRAVVVNGKAHE